MHKCGAKGNIIHILQLQARRLASSNLRGTLFGVCFCVSLCLCMNPCLKELIWELSFAQLCICVTKLTRAFGPGLLGTLHYCSHTCLSGRTCRSSHKLQIHSSLSSGSHLINQATVSFNCQPRLYWRHSLLLWKEISNKRGTKRPWVCHPRAQQ